MRTAILVLLLFQYQALFAQGCFEKCQENRKNAKSIPELEQIVSQLAGCDAPNFDITTLAGETITLTELKGKVVVINFWFTSCAPCIAEMPALNRLVKTYAGKDVIFIAFARDDDQTLKRFLRERKFDYKIVSKKFNLSDAYCLITGWPMNLVVDQRGIVKQIFSGGYTDERAESHVYDLMKPTIDGLLADAR